MHQGGSFLHVSRKPPVPPSVRKLRAKAAAGQTMGWDPPHAVTPEQLALATGMVLKGTESAHRNDGEEFLVSQAFIAQEEK